MSSPHRVTIAASAADGGVAKHGAEGVDGLRDDGVVVERLELRGGAPRGEREEDGVAARLVEVEEQEEAAAVLGVWHDAADKVGVVAPKGVGEEEGDLVQEARAEARQARLLARRQRWVEEHAAVLGRQLQHAERQRAHDGVRLHHPRGRVEHRALVGRVMDAADGAAEADVEAVGQLRQQAAVAAPGQHEVVAVVLVRVVLVPVLRGDRVQRRRAREFEVGEVPVEGAHLRRAERLVAPRPRELPLQHVLQRLVLDRHVPQPARAHVERLVVARRPALEVNDRLAVGREGDDGGVAPLGAVVDLHRRAGEHAVLDAAARPHKPRPVRARRRALHVRRLVQLVEEGLAWVSASGRRAPPCATSWRGQWPSSLCSATPCFTHSRVTGLPPRTSPISTAAPSSTVTLPADGGGAGGGGADPAGAPSPPPVEAEGKAVAEAPSSARVSSECTRPPIRLRPSSTWTE